MAFDFKKEYKEFYMPKNKPEIVNVPKANYIAVRGKGNPNEEGGAYQQAISVLYAVAYTLKMSYKTDYKIEGFFEYVVPPLEGFWWQDDVESVDYTNKSAVVIINESTQHNHLDLLFVKNGVQSNGIGKKIWFELERIYPNTKVWETCTPYFDKRNIHFYVNVCGFHITEFFNEKHPMPDTPDDFVGDGNEGMFAFKKQMRL